MIDSSNKLKLEIKFCKEKERKSFSPFFFFCVFKYRDYKRQEFRSLLFLISLCRYSFLFSPGCLGEQGYVRLWLMAVFLITLLESPNLHFPLSLLRETLCLFKCCCVWLLPSRPDVKRHLWGESSVSHKILSIYFASSLMQFPQGTYKKNMSFILFHLSIPKMTQKSKEKLVIPYPA